MHFWDFNAHSCCWLKTAYFIIKNVNTASTTAQVKGNTTLQKTPLKVKILQGKNNKLFKYHQQNDLKVWKVVTGNTFSLQLKACVQSYAH